MSGSLGLCEIRDGVVTHRRSSAPMDRVGRGIEKFRIFKKDDFEADWIKVTERSFGQVYRVKLKLWREKCALKSFNTTLTGTSLYRYG